MRDEFVAHYNIPEEHIHTCGVPHFDIHCRPDARRQAATVMAALGIDAGRRCILFAMSSPRFAPNEIDIVEWIAQRVASGVYGDAQLLVRPHPQNVSGNMADASWLPRLERIAHLANVAVALPKMSRSRLRWAMADQDMYELAAILAGSTVVLNSGSTVSIDALMHGKPVLITAFDGDLKRNYWNSARRLVDYPHLRTLRDLGGVEVSSDYDDCDAALRRMLDSPEVNSERRRRAMLAECYSDDGHSTDRVVQTLSSR
jgi:CDP-glycerol glycerophosphotransferase (TagB/SpsB family)